MSRRGTTLLETIVALGITALVLAALARVVVEARAARAAAQAAADRTAAARTVLLALAAEIEAARAPGLVVLPPAPAEPWSTLSLAATVKPPPAAARPSTDLHTVTYRVVPDGGGRATGTLVRAERPSVPLPAGAAEAAGEPLLPGVRAFAARVFDGTTWSDGWPGARLPRAVELTLALDDGAEPLTTAVALPAAEDQP
ncbi:MAG TPA: type II secretion system protein GspJ [Candidatus Binatia bacterium]|nr:type II secretion system protein GspJ [Candidatus Binatia bacterium]